MKKITIKTKLGKIKGVIWGKGNAKKILALHGWLDNAYSFFHIGPLLAKEGYEVVALDFPGHGKSDHRSQGQFLHVFDHLLDIQRITEALNWEKTIFLGHSMGAAMSQMFVSSFPEKVDSLIMIENLGAVPSYKEQSAAHSLREALSQWKNHKPKQKRYYKSKEQALEARMKVTPMEKEYLFPMVKRGLKKNKKGYQWRTDKRLKIKSLFRLSEQAVQDFLKNTNVKTLLILAKPTTYAFESVSLEQRKKALNPEKIVYIEGHHHCHMDQPQTVADQIIDFLKK